MSFEKISVYSQDLFEKEIIEPWQGLSPHWKELLQQEDENGKKVFSAEEISADKKRLKEKQAKALSSSGVMTKKEAMLSDEFEYILMECFNDAKWFKENVTVSVGSIYDDWFNGVDFVLCIREEDEDGEDRYDYLSIDATISQDPQTISRKLVRDYENIDKGKLNRVKYFINDDNPDLAGEFYMPHIVLASDSEMLEQVKKDLVAAKLSDYKKNKGLDSFKEKVFKTVIGELQNHLSYAKDRMKREKMLLNKKQLYELSEIILKYERVLMQIEKYKN